MPPTQAELQIILSARDAASAVLQSVGQQVQRLEQQVSAAGSRGTGFLGQLLSGVGLGVGAQALNVVLGTTARGFDLIADSIVGANSRAEETRVAFGALTGSAQTAGQMLEFLQGEVSRTTFPGAQLMAAGQALIPVVHGDQQAFEDLIRTTEVLAARKPEQGLESAAEALRRVSQGDLSVIQREFGLNADAIRAYMARGATAFQAVDLELKRLGADQRLVEAMPRTFSGMVGAIETVGDRIRQRLGAGIFEELREGVARVVAFLDRYGDQILAWATQVGAALGVVAERLAGFLGGIVGSILDLVAPGVKDQLVAMFAASADAAKKLQENTDQAARSAEQFGGVRTLEDVRAGFAAAGDDVQRLNSLLEQTRLPLQQNAIDVAAVGVEAGRVQLEADRLNRSYEDQLYPLQRQQQLLQQNVDLQRIQSQLAGVQAVQQRQRLELEIAALQTAAQGVTDPNAPNLTARQQAIAFALRERELQVQAIDIQEQQRPVQESLQERIQAIQRQQEDALRPLQVQLQNYKDRVAQLQLERQEWDLIVLDVQKVQEAALIKQGQVGPPTPDQAAWDKAMADMKQKGEGMAAAWGEGWKNYWDEHGDDPFKAVTDAYAKWEKTDGAKTLKKIGDELGAALGKALADAAWAFITGGLTAPEVWDKFRAAWQHRLEEFFSGRAFGGERKPIEPLPIMTPQGTAAAEAPAGPTVQVAPGAVQVNGQPDPGLTDRLGEHIHDALDAFGRLLAASSQTDLSSFQNLQGAGR